METKKLKELLAKREIQIDNSIEKKFSKLSAKFNIMLNDFILNHKDEILEFIENCKILYDKGFIVAYSIYDDYWLKTAYNAFVSDRVSNKIGFIHINNKHYGYGVVTTQNISVYIDQDMKMETFNTGISLEKIISILEKMIEVFPYIKKRLDDYISKIEKYTDSYGNN